MGNRPIYLAIMDAFERGAGLHLSAGEVHELGLDDAIVTRAAVALADDDEFVTAPNFTWARAYLRARLAPANSQEPRP